MRRNICFKHISVHMSILIVARGSSGVYEFDGTDYKKVFKCSNGNNALFKTEEGEIFLLSGGNIFKSSENNYSKWIPVGKYKHKVMEDILNR